VFDYVDENLSFDRRLDIAIRNLYGKSSRVSILEQYRVHNAAQVNELYDTAIADGHEGLILKDINGKYKYGRSTLNQELMLKLKEVIDTEGVVIGTAELMLNENEALTDALNNQVRSNHQANKVRGGVLGSLVVRFGEHVVNVGSGFSYGQRILYWQDKSSLIGRVVTFKHLGLSKYGVPRCPIFKGFRED
jgi:DNA ligase-1